MKKFTYIGQPIQYKTAMINAKEKLERAPAQPIAMHTAASPADLITQLDVLRQHGVLTEAEFQTKKAQALKNFLQTLDFVESVTQSGMSRKGRQVKYADFFSMAGLCGPGVIFRRKASVKKPGHSEHNPLTQEYLG